MNDCKYCSTTPREFVISDNTTLGYGKSLKVKTYVCGNTLQTSIYVDKFSEHYFGTEDLCNEEVDLEFLASDKINFCPICGKNLNAKGA